VGEVQRVGIYYRTLCTSGAKAKDQQQAAVYLSLKGKRRHLDLLTPPGAQYGATRGKAEKGNRLRYAGFASPCKPLQDPIYHS
jgi:hypothetical protein